MYFTKYYNTPAFLWQAVFPPAILVDTPKFSLSKPSKRRNNKYRRPFRDAGTCYSAFLNTVSGAVMTTRVLSATDPVKKALPPTTECSPITVAPPRMDAPE